MRVRLGVAAALLACAALSCAALIGIDDRLPDDASGDAAPERGTIPGEDGGAPDAPDTVDGGPPTYGVGDGHTGSLTVSGSIAVNSYAPLSAAASSTNKVTFANVRGAAFANGDLVMVWQTAAAAAVPNGTMIDLAQANVGQWEIARVTAATDTELTFDHAIGVAQPYAVPGAQIVRVPEYADLTLPLNTDIHAQDWDGTSGGIVALYVKGTLRNDGSIQASGAGFRGGVGTVTGASPSNCKAADGIPANGFAHKGEGLVPSAFGDAGGLGSATIGGGGGDCYNAGGGGGGNGGGGGQGGFSGDGARDVGGRGGAAVSAGSLLARLTMGGGGGAGEVDNGRNISGGQGGGVVLVRAQDIVLPGGKFFARGGSPGKADQSGGAGGGAGGSIIVQAAATVGCQLLSVLGGSGASLETTNANNGPGGGGGGGRALVQGAATACSIEVKGGSGGRDITNTTATHGATPLAGAETTAPFVGQTELISTAYCATCP